MGNSAFDEFYEMQNADKGKQRNKKTAGTTLLTQRLLRDATVLDADILKVRKQNPNRIKSRAAYAKIVLGADKFEGAKTDNNNNKTETDSRSRRSRAGRNK